MMAVGRKYIDATDSVLGRLASRVAKYLLEGYEVYIFNAEKVVLVGRWNNLVKYWNHKVNERGDWIKGPFYPKRPDKILRKVIYGMLPKNNRGKDVLKKVKVFLGLPEEFKDIKLEKIEESLIQNRLKIRTVREYHHLGDISRQIGGKF